MDYMDIPIFLLCRDDSQFYVALCTDVEELKYIIVRAAETDIYNLLHGKIPMRGIILNQKAYWEVKSGDDVLLDQITNHNIKDLDMTLLPEENACFKILTEEMRGYVQQFDNAFFDADKFGRTMPEEKLKEIQNYIQYIYFRDDAAMPFKPLSEKEIVKQLTESMKKSDMGATTSADVVSQRMREK